MVINGRNWGFNNSGKFNQVKQLYFDLAQKKSVSSFLRNGGYKMNSKYFDEEKQQKAKKWLDGKANKPCECCGSRVFSVADDLVMPLQFTGGGLTFGGNVYPHLLVICHECGCSRFCSAEVAGIVERKTETEKLIDEIIVKISADYPFKPAKTCDCCMHIKYKLRAIGEKYGMMYSIF